MAQRAPDTRRERTRPAFLIPLSRPVPSSIRRPASLIWAAVALSLVAIRPGGVSRAAAAETPPTAPPDDTGSWVEVGRETFDRLEFSTPPQWRPDTPADTRELPEDARRFADDGEFFHDAIHGFEPPTGYRISSRFGHQGFLTVESYSRQQKDPAELFTVVTDPANPANRVLRLASPDHTDGALIRTNELGTRYHVCARIGYVDFGVGDGKNGYRGGERNEPWLQDHGDATNENGCYFGAIFRTVPRPHNNVLAHHERIAFVDSDNNIEGWTSIWDPETRAFFPSGWHPVVIAVADGRSQERDLTGPPFMAYAANGWNAPGQLFAADAYKENTWYTVCFTRMDRRLTLRISGDFRYGGQTTYEAVLEDATGAFHFNGPHYFCAGDPHINYYEGSLLVDDISLQVWRP